MTVSDKDRDAAIEAANNSFDAWHERDGSLAAAMVDGLIALDWGPRPTVELRALAELRTRVHGEVMIANYLRECGIEVTDV